MKVLIAGDEMLSCRVLENSLENQGYKVQATHEREEASSLFGQEPVRISMYYNKIRNAGNYCEQIDNDIRGHTGTDFNYGISLECYKNMIEPQIWRMQRNPSSS